MAEMTENLMLPDKVLLAAADLGDYDIELSLDELEELVETAGGEVVARVVQKRPAYDSASCIGAGRLEEMAEVLGELFLDVGVPHDAVRKIFRLNPAVLTLVSFFQDLYVPLNPVL